MEQVQNAIDFLKMIGALDEKENLTNLGESFFYPIFLVYHVPINMFHGY